MRIVCSDRCFFSAYAAHALTETTGHETLLPTRGDQSYPLPPGTVGVLGPNTELKVPMQHY